MGKTNVARPNKVSQMRDEHIICASLINSRQFTVQLRAWSDESKVIYRVAAISHDFHLGRAFGYVWFLSAHARINSPRLDRAGREDARNDPADRVDSSSDKEHNLPRLARALQPCHTCAHEIYDDPVNSVTQT